MSLIISAKISTKFGLIHKKWSLDAITGTLQLGIKLDWPDIGIGRFRIIPITLMSENFKSDALNLMTKNGGEIEEVFSLSHDKVDHGNQVSMLVSSSHCLGITDGSISICDCDKKITLRFNPSETAFLGQLYHQPVGNLWITRLTLTGKEVDDTSKASGIKIDTTISYNIQKALFTNE